MPGMLPTTQQPDRHRDPIPADPVGPGTGMPKCPTGTPEPAVTSAASSGTASEPKARPAPPTRGAGNGHGLVAVGPGLAGSMVLGGGFPMNPLPVQPAKIHRPPQRAARLPRERLNTWLDRAAAARLGLIIAEAGFGERRLLAGGEASPAYTPWCIAWSPTIATGSRSSGTWWRVVASWT